MDDQSRGFAGSGNRREISSDLRSDLGLFVLVLVLDLIVLRNRGRGTKDEDEDDGGAHAGWSGALSRMATAVA